MIRSLPSIQIRLHRHERVQLNKIEYYVDARLSTGYIFVGVIDRFQRTVTTAELLAAYDRGEFAIEAQSNRDAVQPDFSALPIHSRKRALQRAKVVKYLVSELGSGPYTTNMLSFHLAEACRLAGHSVVSVATARRWLNFGRNSSGEIKHLNLRRFAPKYKIGPRRSLLSRPVEAEISKIVDEYILRSPPVPIPITYDILCTRIDEIKSRYPHQDIAPPSRATFYRRISAVNDELKVSRQVSRRAARLKYEIVEIGPQAIGPYNTIEIDHTPVNCLLTTTSGVVIGRPWLIAAVDRYSRMCVGFIVTFEPPTGMTIMLLLRTIMLGKDDVLAHYREVESDWPCRGRPFLLIADNGFEFHKIDLTEALAELSIGIEYCATKDPQRKGRVERFFLTLQTELIEGLPGVTFGKKNDEYDPAIWATLTAEKFTGYLLRHIVDYYHHDAHAGLSKQSPYQLFHSYPAGYEIDLSVQRREIDIACLYKTFRHIEPEGISVEGLRFHGPEARRLRVEAQGAGKFEIRYNPLDLGQILVLDPRTKRFASIPAVSPEAAGMSVWQKRETLKHLGRKEPATVARMRKARRDIIEDARRTLESGNPKKNLRKKRTAYRALSRPAPPHTLLATQFIDHGPVDQSTPADVSPVAPHPPSNTEDLDALARALGMRVRRKPR